jgi:hypothetical protein
VRTSSPPDPEALVGMRLEEARDLLAAAPQEVTSEEIESPRPPRPVGPWYVVRARVGPDGRTVLSVVRSRAIATDPAA